MHVDFLLRIAAVPKKSNKYRHDPMGALQTWLYLPGTCLNEPIRLKLASSRKYNFFVQYALDGLWVC